MHQHDGKDRHMHIFEHMVDSVWISPWEGATSATSDPISALCLSSYLEHISRIIIISFFCGAKVLAPCFIKCEDLQTCHHKSWSGTARRTGAVPWGLRAVLMGWNSKEKAWLLRGMKTKAVVKRDLLWSASVCLLSQKGPRFHCLLCSEITQLLLSFTRIHHISPRSTGIMSVGLQKMFFWF